VFLQEDGNRNVVIRGHMDLQTLRITPTATPNLKPVLEFNEYVRYSNRPDPVRVRHDLFQLN